MLGTRHERNGDAQRKERAGTRASSFEARPSTSPPPDRPRREGKVGRGASIDAVALSFTNPRPCPHVLCAVMEEHRGAEIIFSRRAVPPRAHLSVLEADGDVIVQRYSAVARHRWRRLGNVHEIQRPEPLVHLRMHLHRRRQRGRHTATSAPSILPTQWPRSPKRSLKFPNGTDVRRLRARRVG